jgi:xanthine/uracil permease
MKRTSPHPVESRVGGGRPARWAVLIGATIGFVASYLYFNLDDIERMAAEADGFPLWSWYEVPFTLPWVVLGALVSLVAVVLFQKLRG